MALKDTINTVDGFLNQLGIGTRLQQGKAKAFGTF